MITIEIEIQVDDLVDYNEVVAHPTECNYAMKILAEVDQHSLEIGDIGLYDYAKMESVKVPTLTDRDQLKLKKIVRRYLELNIDDLFETIPKMKSWNLGGPDEN